MQLLIRGQRTKERSCSCYLFTIRWLPIKPESLKLGFFEWVIRVLGLFQIRTTVWVERGLNPSPNPNWVCVYLGLNFIWKHPAYDCRGLFQKLPAERIFDTISPWETGPVNHLCCDDFSVSWQRNSLSFKTPGGEEDQIAMGIQTKGTWWTLGILHAHTTCWKSIKMLWKLNILGCVFGSPALFSTLLTSNLRMQ